MSSSFLSETTDQMDALQAAGARGQEVLESMGRVTVMLQERFSGLKETLGASMKGLSDSTGEAGRNFKKNTDSMAVQAEDLSKRTQKSFSAMSQQIEISTSVGVKKFASTGLNSFETLVTGVLTRQRSMGAALGTMWKQLSTSFIRNMVTGPLRRMTTSVFQQGGLFRWLAGEQAASARIGSIQASAANIQSATTSITAHGASAATGAMESQSFIPFIGPALAAAAFAFIMSKVASVKSSLPSASGGWDIPSGVNPMAQLHEREMVLPAQYADVLRNMADAPQDNIRQDTHIHVHAVDARSVSRLFNHHGSSLVQALKTQRRNFAF